MNVIDLNLGHVLMGHQNVSEQYKLKLADSFFCGIALNVGVSVTVRNFAEHLRRLSLLCMSLTLALSLVSKSLALT